MDLFYLTFCVYESSSIGKIVSFIAELPLDENSKEYKKQKKKCETKLKKMFNRMKAVMSIPVFKYV